MGKVWRGLLAPIGKPTGDGRMFAAGGLSSRDLPMPLRFQRADIQGHGGAVVVGRITKIDFTEDGIWGEGDFMDPKITPEVTEAQTLLSQKVIGPSVDLDDAEIEPYTLDDDAAEELAKAGEDCGCGSGVTHDDKGKPQMALVTKGRVSAATLVQIPAFAEAHGLELSDEDVEALTASVWSGGRIVFSAGDAVLVEGEQHGDEDRDAYLVFANDDEAGVVYDDGSYAVVAAWRIEHPRAGEQKAWEAALVAAGNRTNPPDDWFTSPELDGPTPIQVDADGRVFGHLAQWGSCHIGFANECVQPPESATDYAYFHTGSVETASGQLLPIGRITLGTGHAGLNAGAFAAAEHYDNTGSCVAVVRAGEDEHGIWVSGALVPEAGPERVAELRRSPLSGDWRDVGGNLELVAALAVNTPGFGIVKTKSRVASGRPVALVAAGFVPMPEPEDETKKRKKKKRPADTDDDDEYGSYTGLAAEIGKAISAEFTRRAKRENDLAFAMVTFAELDEDRAEEAATLLAAIGGE
jgi:hypothetical protein